MDSENNLSPRALAEMGSHEEHEHPCTAEVELTEEEREALKSRAVFLQIPADGSGYECYGPPQKRFGRSATVQAVLHICAQWAEKHPQAPRIGVGNISYEQGGPMPPHTSHNLGIDVDFSPITNDGREVPVQWHQAHYSRELTQDFVNLIRENPFTGVRVIYFNDPQMRGVTDWPGHDDHLHVRFEVVEGQSANRLPSASENLRLADPYLHGPRVEALQEGLVKAGITVDVDGVFGKDTDRAVKEFQEQQGLVVDGIAGPNTLAKLGEVANA